MATTLLDIGDFHAAPGPRNADRYTALDQIIREGLTLSRLGAWLWPGDLNDARMTIDDRNALAERLVTMGMVAPVVICYGNHDLPGDLDVFARLKTGHPIYVVDTPHCLRFRLATGENATAFVLPYPHKAGLAAAGLAPSDVVATAGDLLEPIFMVAADELEKARAAGDLTLMIGHVNVAGAIASTGQPNIGREIELSPRHLERLGDIPKLLNHIHKPQEIAGAHYAGSVCRLDYGEVEEKRFLLVHFYDEDSEIVSRPIAIAPMFHIDGRLDPRGFSVDSRDEKDDEEIHRRLAAKDWTGCDVRVRYSYRSSEKAVLDEQTVRDQFVGALRLKVEGIVDVSDREIRSPEVAAAKTLPEKVAAYRKVETLEPSVADKLAALEQQDAARLLASVSAALVAIERPQDVTVAA